MEIKKVPVYFRALDYLLFPFMWMICGFKFELPQETHRWHMRNYSSIKVSNNKSVTIDGTDDSKYKAGGFPLFHMPIFGGWKNYVILEAKNFGKYWNIGWIVNFKDDRKTVCQIQASRIFDSQLKLLTGINDSTKTFFAVGDNGEFADIKLIDEGKIGDGKFRKVRLF